MCYFSKQVNIKNTHNPEQEKWRTAVCHTLIQLWGVNNSKVDAKATGLTLISEMLLSHCVGAFSTHGSRGLIASVPASPCETGAIPHFQHSALTTPSSHGPLLPRRSFPGHATHCSAPPGRCQVPVAVSHLGASWEHPQSRRRHLCFGKSLLFK